MILTGLIVFGLVIAFFKLIGFALKAAWSIGKIILAFLLLPVIIVGIIFAGLIYLLIPLAIIGIIVCAIRKA